MSAWETPNQGSAGLFILETSREFSRQGCAGVPATASSLLMTDEWHYSKDTRSVVAHALASFAGKKKKKELLMYYVIEADSCNKWPWIYFIQQTSRCIGVSLKKWTHVTKTTRYNYTKLFKFYFYFFSRRVNSPGVSEPLDLKTEMLFLYGFLIDLLSRRSIYVKNGNSVHRKGTSYTAHAVDV